MAVDGMGVRDIVVCGHSQCAAIAGLLNPQLVASLPNMQRWLRGAAAAKRVVDDELAGRPREEQLARAIEENVLAQLDHLRTHPAVADAIARKQLDLHGWVYELETGEVLAYDPEVGRFTRLKEV
jgi:carbonic anhydrase